MLRQWLRAKVLGSCSAAQYRWRTTLCSRKTSHCIFCPESRCLKQVSEFAHNHAFMSTGFTDLYILTSRNILRTYPSCTMETKWRKDVFQDLKRHIILSYKTHFIQVWNFQQDPSAFHKHKTNCSVTLGDSNSEPHSHNLLKNIRRSPLQIKTSTRHIATSKYVSLRQFTSGQMTR